MRIRHFITLPLAASACVLIFAGCGNHGTEPAKAKEQTPAAAPVAAEPSSIQKQLSGEVSIDPAAPELKQMSIEPVKAVPVPVDEVTTMARIQANPHNVGHAVVPVPGRVMRVMGRLGDTVEKGQPLVTIESTAVAEAEAAFVQSEVAVRQAEIAYAKAEADLTRITDLFEHEAVAQKEMLSAKTTTSLTKASVEQAKSSQVQARRRLELLGLKPGEFQQHVVVRAPIAGKVMEVSVVEGEFRNEINTPLITITDLSHVWVTSEVPESKIRLFRVGGVAHLTLIAYPNETFHAKITRLADSVDADTRTVKVNAELTNTNGRLRPDMFGSLQYSAGEMPQPWIPETAVVRMNGADLVFVERAPGRFKATRVELGKLGEGGYPVNKGIKTGERVVTKGAIYLKAAL